MITIKDISRTGHVTRWHMVRTNRDQTLAEHLYLVTMYAQEIADRVLKNYTDEDKLNLVLWCLEHDTPEILTGDIPTPAKRRLQESLKDGEVDRLEELENSIASENYRNAKENVKGTRLEIITKLADLIDGIVFISVEGATEHSRVIEKKLLGSFYKVISIGKSTYPKDDWGKSELILNQILLGAAGQIDFESDF
jgi:5'-deoxynucleotidase